MITKVKIKDFRSFGVTSGSRPHEFSLDSLTVIVGDNSAGKSNIMRALVFATSPEVDKITRTDFFIRIAKDKPRKSGKIEIDLTSDIDGTKYHIHCVGTGSDIKGYVKKFTINGKSYPEVTLIAPADRELVDALEPHRVFLAPTVRDIEYLSTAKDLLPLATRSTISGTSKQLKEELTRKLKNICIQLRAPLSVKGVSVTPQLDIDELMKVVRLGFEVDDNIQLPVQNIGQGHISKGILKLAELQGAHKTICIEEPEIHVHPTGIKSLLKTFKEVTYASKRQIIVTTHSPEVINNVDFTNLLSVKKEGQRSIVKPILASSIGTRGVDPDRIEHTILRKDQRGDLFLSKYVLLVEGVYDRLALELLDRDGRLGLVERDIRVVELGGVNEFSKYHHLLKEIGRPYAVLLDDSGVFERQADSHGAHHIVNGAVLNGLSSDIVLSKMLGQTINLDQYHQLTPQAKRKMIKNTWRITALKSLILLAHGHQDLKGIIKECWIAVQATAERQAVYKALGGRNPHPTSIEIDNLVAKALGKKSFDMIKVIAALPVNRFERLSRHLVNGLTQLKQT